MPSTRPSADQVMQHLLEGNQRFQAGEIVHPRRTPEDFRALAAGQSPLAVIIGCADSRVTPEILFDCGIGELFVVRIAGNYIAGAGASVKGSVEFAVAELGVPLIMVLGHSQCGAIKAAIQHIDDRAALPGALNDLVNSIKPAVTASVNRPGELLDNAIAANVRRGVTRLRSLRPVVAPALKEGRVKIVGCTYDIETGKVTVLA
ncbi:carbonic anhydrase [Acidipila rosea]|uniref:Carbonic anhydrase n=2 Tax=Acidipila rosea TaxID=768535 RepID=A0A4R1L207_9BACT|nr:carbonic anhydrase [Acidipila rosea]